MELLRTLELGLLVKTPCFDQLHHVGALTLRGLMEQTCGAVMGGRCSGFSPGGGHMHSAPVTKVEIVIIDKGVA